MNRTDKDRLSRQTQKRYLWLRFKNGVWELKRRKRKLLLFPVLYAAVILAWSYGKGRIRLEHAELISPVFSALSGLSFPLLLIGGTVILLILLGTPVGNGRTADNLRRAGLTNSAGETPVLVTKRRDRNRPEIRVYEFDGAGIPLKEWEDKRQRIEAALNVHIVKLKEGQTKRRILLYAVPAGRQLSGHIPWKDGYLISDSSTFLLGESLSGPVTVDISKIPHILLGGSTGSGKSVLLKLLLMQTVKKGAAVSIADFKCGVDFPPVWHRKCRICFEENSLMTLLDELVTELQRRKTLFQAEGCPNIDEYNRRTGNALQRHIFACDEVAEILDKTGLTKEQKETVGRIESRLAIIARQGRAFGIHLVLATQRPDANILSGQIRSNIDCRICGRADNVLSQIILDSTAAAEQIPKDAAGRFLLHDGTLFQAYIFQEDNL